MECGLGFKDLVHNFGHFITSVLHNFGSALYFIKIVVCYTLSKDLFIY